MDTEEAKRHANFVGINIAIFFAGVAGVALYYQKGGWLVFFIGMAAYGIARCIFYLLLMGNSPAPALDKTAVPVHRPEPEPPLEDEENEPETAVEVREPVIIEDIRLYRLHNNQIVRLPETVSPKHFGIVREARRRGDLPVVNQNRLNSIGVSRFGVAPNAATMLSFLQGIGAVDDGGQWTAEGDKMFPPPSPINHNGRNLTA